MGERQKQKVLAERAELDERLDALMMSYSDLLEYLDSQIADDSDGLQ